MENEKVKYLIDMINDMDLTNKLRLAICMSDSSCTNLKYDKPEMYKYFDSMLKEIDEDKYNNFLDNAQIFLKSDKIKLFDGEEYARNVYYLIDHAGQKDFKITKKYKRKLTISVAKNRIKKYLGKWKHEMLGDWM